MNHCTHCGLDFEPAAYVEHLRELKKLSAADKRAGQVRARAEKTREARIRKEKESMRLIEESRRLSESQQDVTARRFRELSMKAALESYPDSRPPSPKEAVAIAADFLSGPKPEYRSKSKPPDLSYAEDSNFRIYKVDEFPAPVVDFCQQYFEELNVVCPDHKEQKWYGFVATNFISCPPDFSFAEKKWNLHATLKLRARKDQVDLSIFKAIDPDYLEEQTARNGAKFYRIAERHDKKGPYLLITDTMLALTLLVMKLQKIVITNYPKASRRRKKACEEKL